MVARRVSKPASESPSNGGIRFGGKSKNVHLPSGSKLVFDQPDQDGIIKFMGKKDLSEKMGKDPGEVVYLVANDGKRTVSFPTSYAFTEFEFEPGKYYYLHLVDLVQTSKDFNAMKDFNVEELGEEGEKVPMTSDRLPGVSEITLTLANIKELNYTMLNYPLRVA